MKRWLTEKITSLLVKFNKDIEDIVIQYQNKSKKGA